MEAGNNDKTANREARKDRTWISASVPEATADRLRWLISIAGAMPSPPQPVTADDWAAASAAGAAAVEPFVAQQFDALGATCARDQLGGVPVLRVKPPQLRSTVPLFYTHGGGYVSNTADSTRSMAALLACAAGQEVISVDYQLAPVGNWETITDEVIRAWTALLDSGVDARGVCWFGDSAGGGLAAGTTLKLRDRSLPMPAALLLLSPWSDLTGSGDTAVTLDAWDLLLRKEQLDPMARAYAAPEHQRHPYASPAFGDFREGFPPTLIQCGTREIVLSDSVRLYQAIRRDRMVAELDIYEGMPHVFQALLPQSEETRTALERAVEFFRRHSNAV